MGNSSHYVVDILVVQIHCTKPGICHSSKGEGRSLRIGNSESVTTGRETRRAVVLLLASMEKPAVLVVLFVQAVLAEFVSAQLQ